MFSFHLSSLVYPPEMVDRITGLSNSRYIDLFQLKLTPEEEKEYYDLIKQTGQKTYRKIPKLFDRGLNLQITNADLSRLGIGGRNSKNHLSSILIDYHIRKIQEDLEEHCNMRD